ncbi:MAG TPA: hypothetical protein VFF73_07245 [Planctomycetota bacterium]|nr:hypothetical protein [Planctomycetota bacterium]
MPLHPFACFDLLGQSAPSTTDQTIVLKIAAVAVSFAAMAIVMATTDPRSFEDRPTPDRRVRRSPPPGTTTDERFPRR